MTARVVVLVAALLTACSSTTEIADPALTLDRDARLDVCYDVAECVASSCADERAAFLNAPQGEDQDELQAVDACVQSCMPHPYTIDWATDRWLMLAPDECLDPQTDDDAMACALVAGEAYGIRQIDSPNGDYDSCDASL